MKLILLSMAFFLVSINFTNATVWTVNNSSSGAAQFTSLQTAVNDASPGDTILVHPTSLSYGNISLTKRLVIIGGGYNASDGGKSLIGTFTLQSGAANLADSLSIEIIGFEFSSINTIGSMSNVIFRRCYFTSGLSGTLINSYFESCWFRFSLYFNMPNTYTYLTFRNCIISQSHTSQAWFINSVGGNNTFDHCVFYSRITSEADISFYGNSPLAPITFNNCIFDGRLSFNFTSLSTFNNCLIDTEVGSGHAAKLAVLNDNTSFPNSNIAGNPNFTNYNPPSLVGLESRFLLNSGSPAIGAGTGGSDIGLHGGAVNFIYDGLPPIPIVSQAILVNPITPADENVQILIDAFIQQ